MLRFAVTCLAVLLWAPLLVFAQGNADQPNPPENGDEAPTTAPEKVDVVPVAEDIEISQRLERILEATNWFLDPLVEVDEGVVFLQGTTANEEHKTWAGQLARNTQDVVAVVNRISVDEPLVWDISPAWASLKDLARESIQMSPLIVVSALLLLVSALCAGIAFRLAAHLLRNRVQTLMLRHIIARGVAVVVFILGLYLVLRISGLTRLAATVIGGTGLMGIVVGIAFRDIAENFLASLLISMNRPFRMGELIQVGEHLGVVHNVTTRGTLLMTLEGNHVHIPNSNIYKSVVANFSANPKTRFDFTVGIDFSDAVTEAQQVAMEALRSVSAILKDPPPLVLVESLGAATVNLRVYFWVDAHKHDGLKVKSSAIRHLKTAFEEAGLTMPDEAREIIFPKGVPVLQLDEAPDEQLQKGKKKPLRPNLLHHEVDAERDAEGGLESSEEVIKDQAKSAPLPGNEANILVDEE